MVCLSSLPEEVLKLILQLVPPKDRLGSCCLVSKRLHAAAVASTDRLNLRHLLPRQAESSAEWINKHGRYLTSLHIFAFPQMLQQLPCPNLLDLELDGCSAQLGTAADGSPGVLQACTKLTRLVLHYNKIYNPGSLSCLVNLQHLDVRLHKGLNGFGPVWRGPDATLPRLQQLTYLHVDSLSADNLLQLGGLTDLQELHLIADDTCPVGPSRVPGVVLPASLTKLELLSRIEAGLLSLVPCGLRELKINCDVEGPAEGPGSFLSGIARLQRLTRLELSPNGLNWPPTGVAYAVLTSSSSLVYLSMVVTRFPPGIWPHVFSSAQLLPHLTQLDLRDFDYDEDGAFGESPLWGPADLPRLVSACPSLRAIGNMALQPGMHVSELHKLTALTCVEAWCFSDNLAAVEESVRGLAAVTRLRSLLFTSCIPLGVASLLPLTSLTALTNLNCDWHNAEEQDGGLIVRISTQIGSVPDVWLQLLERCAAEPGCHATVLRSLAQQLGQQRTLTAQQQQQIASLQQLHAAQQQQLTNVLEQMSAQQQVAARQIAGLQEQLQQLLQRQQQQ